MKNVLDNKLVIWYKIIAGMGGVIATVSWFVFIVGSPVVVTLGGVPVLGSIGFMCILLGNGYGLWCLAKSGLADLKEYRTIKQRHEGYAEYHKEMREEDERNV